MTDCPGPCNAWWRGLTEAQQAATGHAPRPGEPTWCHPDASRIRRQLTELPDLAALLERLADGYAQQGTGPAANGHNPRSPSPVADDIDELDDFLVTHEMAFRADFNRRNPDRPMLPSPPRRGGLATVTDTTTAWLARHLTDILATDMAVHFGAEISQKHWELAAKTAVLDTRRRGEVPCPNVNCRLMTLAWVDGYEGLICGACGRYVTRAEYEDDVRAARRHLEHAS